MRHSPLFGSTQQNAAMTGLPPSPDMTSSIPTPQRSNVPEFLLNGGTPVRFNSTGSPLALESSLEPTQRRLRSIAKYGSFHPQVLACSSDIIVTSYKDIESSVVDSVGPSSLGAIAGPRGVALFRISRPHVPLVMFSHATNSMSARSAISSMKFQPSISGKSLNSLYLAAARGSGVLIWDASGHNSNPLLSRLLVDQMNDVGTTSGSGTANALSHHINSIDWKHYEASSSGSEPLLATTTATDLSLWDLRSSDSSGGLKPSLRFGNARNPHGGVPKPLVQVACSSTSEECATIDAAGVVCIYDIRMTERGRSPIGSPMAAFVAHEAGVGIDHLPLEVTSSSSNSSQTESSWVTWGVEPPMESAVIKVWRNTFSISVRNPVDGDTAIGNVESDDYWYMSEESPNQKRAVHLPTASSHYQMVAQCKKSSIACARICSFPVKNSIMVVGMNTSFSVNSVENDGGWWAELYSMTPEHSEGKHSESTFGLSREARILGGSSNQGTDKKSSSSMLGNLRPGRLVAAELAFATTMKNRSKLHNEAAGRDTIDKSEISDDGVELILCCLSDSGVISTSAIPEALPKLDRVGRSNVRGKSLSPGKKIRNKEYIRTTFPSSVAQARVFPEINEGSTLPDLAGMFTGNAYHRESSLYDTSIESKTEKRSGSPLKSFGIANAFTDIGRRTELGGYMPFDMDVHVQSAYNNVNTGGLGELQVGTTPGIPSALLGNSLEDADTTRNATIMMNGIETARIPCPRLCGACFGPGNDSRLVMFHNGEVQKMWSWYQKSDTSKLSNVAVGQNDTISVPNSKMILADKSSKQIHQMESNAQNLGPRSLKELKDMMNAAKEAQWGEANETSASHNDGMSALEKYFEDESLESNSDESGDDDDDEDGGDDDLPHPGDEIYKRYFGTRLMRDSMIEDNTSEMLSASNVKASFGISTDMLSPIVTIVCSEKRVIQGQNIDFAKNWKLGNWAREQVEKNVERNLSSTLKDNTFAKLQLPHYRDLPTSSPERGAAFVKTRSDPNLSKTESHRKLSRDRPKDEPGVHGGHYIVRPNIEESMTFLNKLYSHQKGAGTTFPTLISPPDSPVLLIQRYSTDGRVGARSRVAGVPLEKRTLDVQKIQSANLGVHTLSKPIEKNTREKVELKEIENLCLHNAKVCSKFGDYEKENVWMLFADTVQGYINNDDKIFSGWGGKGGGALGVEMIAHFFEYYEKLGDVQMLATMFCVLSGGHRRDTRKDHFFFLPQGRDAVYNTYIFRYAEMLYSWGLLNLRTELYKHLKYSLAKDNEFMFLSSEPNDSTFGGGTAKEGVIASQDGLVLLILCPTCNTEIQSNNGFCPRCQDFSFRCSICDLAVRGLSTYCESCHHGGHLNHIVEWFSKANALCPTGCGCQCNFFMTPPHQQHQVAGSCIPVDRGLSSDRDIGLSVAL